jgi:hypothetical protein
VDWQQVIAATLAVVLPALGVLLRAYVQTRWTPERLAHVQDIARGAVRAADEVYKASVSGTASTDKAAWASDVVKAGAARLGVKLSDSEAASIVHSALEEWRALEVAPPEGGDVMNPKKDERTNIG